MNFDFGNVFRNIKNNGVNNNIDKTKVEKINDENAQSVKKYAVPEYYNDEEVVLRDDPEHPLMKYAVPPMPKYAIPDEPAPQPTVDIQKYSIPPEPSTQPTEIISMYAIYPHPSIEPDPEPTEIISMYAIYPHPSIEPGPEPTEIISLYAVPIQPSVEPTVTPTVEPSVTPTIPAGEKGSEEYFSKLWDKFADFNQSFHAYEYDEQGRVIKGGNQDLSSGSICNTDVWFDISYGDNGDVNIDSKWLGKTYKKINIKNDGTTTVTNYDKLSGEITSIEKYDADGKLITDPSTEPTVTPTTAPTVTPTVEPTTEPTVTPTAEPTVAPTPTTTPEPTVQPTPGTTVTHGVRYNPFSFNLTNIFGNTVFGRFFGGLNSRLNDIISRFFFKL